MLTREEFGQRYIPRMKSIIGRENDECPVFAYTLNEFADNSYEMYEQDPNDMTPEEHAEEEVQEWLRN